MLYEVITQTIQEVFWQPYFNNGKQLQLYGQVWGTLESPDAYGWDYTVSNIGVRYEPLSDYNLVVSAEHFFPLGVEADDDTRLKVGFSWDTGLELEPYVKDWAYVNLFTEEIYSLSNYNWANVTDFRVGRSYRFDELDPLTSLYSFPFTGMETIMTDERGSSSTSSYWKSVTQRISYNFV